MWGGRKDSPNFKIDTTPTDIGRAASAAHAGRGRNARGRESFAEVVFSHGLILAAIDSRPVRRAALTAHGCVNAPGKGSLK